MNDNTASSSVAEAIQSICTRLDKPSSLRIAVLGGGHSAEAEVSRSSARAIVAALEEYPSYEVHSVELDSSVAATLLRLQPDVVFPALHGPPGEDGTVQGLLEMLGLPYVGSGVQPSAFAMDKSVAKALFKRVQLPVATDCVYRTNPAAKDLGAAEIALDIADKLGVQVVIKPMQQGSAIGVTPLPNGPPDGDLSAPVQKALALGESILVEPFVVGREITVGVLDLDGQCAIPHPVIEVVTADNEWYDYNNRYAQGGSSHIIPADVDEAMTENLQYIAVKAHEVLGLRDLSRADFILPPQGPPILLEVNTLPGMTPTSLYPDGASALGLSFAQLLGALVESAMQRARGT